MMESTFRELVQSFHDIVEGIEQFALQEEERVVQLRAKLRLFDGTILRVREIYITDRLEAYAYYWLRPDDSLIIGWDNARHHPDIKTFPHHKHIADQVETSEERNLGDVFQVIKTFFANL